MRIASVADVKAQLSAYLKESEQGPVVVTRNGKPAAVLLAVTNEDELERLILAHSPRFRALLDNSRRQIEESGGIPHDEFWREVNAESRNGPAAGRRMNKPTAIARFNAYGHTVKLTLQNTIFANINSRQQVWWVDISRGKLSDLSERQCLHFLLYDNRSDQLHHLAVAVAYFRKNYAGPDGRDKKAKIRLELSTDPSRLFQDVRPGHRSLPFSQFLQSSD